MGIAGALFMNLSKAFYCVNHDLLIAKLYAYGFGRDVLYLLYLLYSSLTGRKQMVEIKCSFSDSNEVSHGVPQGSVLGPLLFNIYINYIFFLVTDTGIRNYADDTTIFSCDYEINNILETLERDANLLSDWFVDNYMKMKDDKSHLLMFCNKENTLITIGQSPLMESQNEK